LERQKEEKEEWERELARAEKERQLAGEKEEKDRAERIELERQKAERKKRREPLSLRELDLRKKWKFRVYARSINLRWLKCKIQCKMENRV